MIAAKPMFLSKASAMVATAAKASSVSTCSGVEPRWSTSGVPVVGVAPVPEAVEARSRRCLRSVARAAPGPTPAGASSPSASNRIDISCRPPRTTNRIAASTVLTARLAKKIVSGDSGRPASATTELVMMP